MAAVLLAGWQQLIRPSNAAVLLSEIMPVNDSTLQDDLGGFSDWIEITNTGEAAVDLTGWGLSDDPERPFRWVFPGTVIRPGEFMVLHASGEDRRTPGQPLHLNFRLSGDGEFLGLFRPDGTMADGFDPDFPPMRPDESYGIPMGAGDIEVTAPASPASYLVPSDNSLEGGWFLPGFQPGPEWRDGQAAVGFDTTGRYLREAVLTEVPAGITSLYLRIPFELDAPGNVLSMKLEAAFDDGFAAFLNGRKVITVNAPDELDWNAAATAVVSGNTVPDAQTFDLTAHRDLLGKSNLLAIQVLNVSSLNSDMLWRGSLLVRQVSGFDPGAGPSRLQRPSPGEPNGFSGAPVVRPPVMSQTGGVLSEFQTLEITHPDPAALIRYTVDGSIPDESARIYTGPVGIRRNGPVIARAFRDGSIPSQPVSSFFIFRHLSTRDWNSSLPVLVFQKNEAERIGDSVPSSGHLLMATPSEDGITQWSTPELVTPAALRVRGSSTAGRPKSSFSLELRDLDGDDADHPMLGMPAESDWVLYGPYNFDRALMRNAFIYDLSRRIGRYAPHTRFVELFITDPGQSLHQSGYMGLYVLMEKIKRGEDRVDVEPLRQSDTDGERLTGGYIFKIDRLDPGDSGISAGGQRLAMVEPKESELIPEQRRYLQNYVDAFNRSLILPASGNYRQFIDTGSWVDHHILNEFTKNPDAFRLSAYMHKPRSGPIVAGPVWDFDRTMGNDDDDRAFNPVGWSNVRTYGWYGPLLRDPDFQQMWIDRFQNLQEDSGPMAVESMHAVIDGMADEIREAAARNYQRWPQVAPPFGTFQTEVDQLKTWVRRRMQWINSLYPDKPRLTTSLMSPADGPVFLDFENGSGVIHYRIDGLDPRAPGGAARTGNRTHSRTGNPRQISSTVRITARARSGNTWSAMMDRYVVIGPAPELRISEIHYHPASTDADGGSGGELEFLELVNHGDSTIRLDGLRVIDGIDFSFPDISMDPGEVIVLAADPEALASSRPDNGAGPIIGPYGGRLSNSGERIAVVDAAGRIVDEVTYMDSPPWPEAADGSGPSLQRTDLDASSGDASSWRASTAPSPGTIEPASPAIVGSSYGSDGILRLRLSHHPGRPVFIEITRSLHAPEWTSLTTIPISNGEPEPTVAISPASIAEEFNLAAFFLRIR